MQSPCWPHQRGGDPTSELHHPPDTLVPFCRKGLGHSLLGRHSEMKCPAMVSVTQGGLEAEVSACDILQAVLAQLLIKAIDFTVQGKENEATSGEKSQRLCSPTQSSAGEEPGRTGELLGRHKEHKSPSTYDSWLKQSNWKGQKEHQGLLGWEKLGYWVEDSGEEIKITHISLDGRFMDCTDLNLPTAQFQYFQKGSQF